MSDSRDATGRPRAAVRIYVHNNGEYLTICPEDGQGDVVLPMPKGLVDWVRVVDAVKVIRSEVGLDNDA